MGSRSYLPPGRGVALGPGIVLMRKRKEKRLGEEQFVITMLNSHLANQCTKFEDSKVSSFSRASDIIGGTKSRDHNHAPFGGDFSFFW